MGSLAVAQAIGGAGKGLVDYGTQRKASEERDLDRMHQKRLQSMRDTAAMARTERVGELSTEAAEATRKFQTEVTEDERTYQAGLVAGTQAREDFVREDEQEHAIDIQAMKQWLEKTESTSFTTKDGKWEMSVISKGELIPGMLFPVETDTPIVREPGTPFIYVQHGMTMLPHNYTEEQQETALRKANNPDDVQNSDTKALMDRAGKKNDVSSEFMRVYGYLPAEYFRKIRNSEQGPEGFQEFRKTFRAPANMPPIETPQAAPQTTPAPVPTAEPEASTGMLSDAAAAGDMSPPALPPEPSTAAGDMGPPALPATASPPEPVKAALSTLADPERVGKGGRQVMELLRTKPWIRNIVARYKRGLPLTPEEIAQVEALLDETRKTAAL